MAFVAKVQFEGPHSIRWSYELTLAGLADPTPLCRSMAVTVESVKGNLPCVWDKFFGADQPHWFKADEIPHYQLMIYAIVTCLREIETSEDRNTRLAFHQLFDDRYLQASDGIDRLVRDIDENGMRLDPQDRAALMLVLYKAIFLYLRNSNPEATQACLYSIWQWYNLAKWLSLQACGAYLELLASAEHKKAQVEKHPYRVFVGEMAEAHHALSRMLESPPDYDEAIKWLAHWSAMNPSSVPLLREKMRLSLPLMECAGNFLSGEIRIPLAAPGWGKETAKGSHGIFRRVAAGVNPQIEPSVDWAKTQLHPEFEVTREKETAGRQAIRGMIGGWLLPRYDFTNAFRLARLLKKNAPVRARFPIGPVVLALIFILPALLAIFTPDRIRQAGWFFPGAAGLEWVLVGAFLIALSQRLDHSVLPYLILPRVAGGVLVGYLALILSKDSFNLLAVFFGDRPCWVSAGFAIALWVMVLFLGFQYLYNDALPFVGMRHRQIANWRACQALLVALALSAFIGLFLLAIASQMYLGDPIPASRLVLPGPLGAIDWQTYVIFVPIALFTGLVTQFIFEEKTVTTSVWTREVE